MNRARAACAIAGILFALFLFGAPAAAQEEDLPPPKVQTIMAWNMSPKTGTMQINNTDLTIGGLSLERFNQGYPGKNKYHVQNNPEHGQFGFRMSSNFDIYVMPSAQGPTKAFVGRDGQNHILPLRYYDTVHIGSGASGLYEQLYSATSGTVFLLNGDASSGRLTYFNGVYTYLNSAGDIYTFNPSVGAGGTIGGGIYSQRVDNILFADGRTQKFYYDANKYLKLVTDSTGYAILFDIGSNGFVADACAIDLARSYVDATSTCDLQPRKVTYQYDATPQLTSFTDALGGVTTYSYGAFENAGDLACVKPPSYDICKASLGVNANDGLNETLADGSVWRILAPEDASWVNYDWDFPLWNDADGAQVIDPAGKMTSIGYSNSSPLFVTDPYDRTTTYKWSGGANTEDTGANLSQDGTMLTEVDYPEGNKYFATYSSSNFNAILTETQRAKTGSSLPDRVVYFTYGSIGASGVTLQNLAKPLSRTDPKGNRTDWTYAAWGGMLTEMKPAPATGAARPLKVYTYVQKAAYILSAGGSLVSTGQSIWMPDTMTECQTAAGSSPSPVCDASAPQRVTSYEYGADGTADNMLVRGVAVTAYIGSTLTTLRTCYGYDTYSRKISTTTPGAGRTGCS